MRVFTDQKPYHAGSDVRSGVVSWDIVAMAQL